MSYFIDFYIICKISGLLEYKNIFHTMHRQDQTTHANDNDH